MKAKDSDKGGAGSNVLYLLNQNLMNSGKQN